jgi:hypothetical protein
MKSAVLFIKSTQAMHFVFVELSFIKRTVFFIKSTIAMHFVFLELSFITRTVNFKQSTIAMHFSTLNLSYILYNTTRRINPDKFTALLKLFRGSLKLFIRKQVNYGAVLSMSCLASGFVILPFQKKSYVIIFIFVTVKCFISMP